MQDKLNWVAVWEYALQEVQVTTVLRMLLDDAQTSVVTAAAQALAVLVGPGLEEEEVWEAADNNPATGKLAEVYVTELLQLCTPTAAHMSPKCIMVAFVGRWVELVTRMIG